MKGIVIHCGHHDCHKLLAKNVNLPVGASLDMKCAHCNKLNCICSEKDGVKVKTIFVNLVKDN